MTFVQLNFLVFLLAVFAVFYICPVKFRWIVLLIASLAFYAIAGLEYLPFIFLTSFSVWMAGKRMGQIYEAQEQECSDASLSRKEKKELKEKAKMKCRKVLIALLILNVGVLCICKFTKFAIEPLNAVLGRFTGFSGLSAAWIIVPLGISYYTFSSLSYLLDVYWRRVEKEENYFRFLLYVSYFPHILQGPIARYGRLGERLKAELRFDYQRVTFGIQLIVWGFFKKLVIADRLYMFVSGVYADPTKVNAEILIITALLDVVYLYSDWSGCMDIARGASQIFGVELDLNFDHPFSSRSLGEFWRKWHMSMGSWFKDYVYFPISTSGTVKKISRSCKGKLPDQLTRVLVTLLPVSVTWILTGVWHGTGMTYLCWGIYYAVAMLLSICFGDDLHKLAQKAGVNTENESWHLLQTVRTTLIFTGGRLLTGPGELWKTKAVVTGMLTRFEPWKLFDGTLYTYGLDVRNFWLGIICVILLGVIGSLQIRGSVREWIAKQGIVFRWMIYVAGVMSVVIFGIYGVGFNSAAFVYMGF